LFHWNDTRDSLDAIVASIPPADSAPTETGDALFDEWERDLHEGRTPDLDRKAV